MAAGGSGVNVNRRGGATRAGGPRPALDRVGGRLAEAVIRRGGDRVAGSGEAGQEGAERVNRPIVGLPSMARAARSTWAG